MKKLTEKVLQSLITLERTLLEPEIRANTKKLDCLLSDQFHEISSNGVLFDKKHVLSRLPMEKVPQFYNQDFKGMWLCEHLAQITYRTAYRRTAKSELNYSMRMSIWEMDSSGWRLLFHQGTPCPKFDLNYDAS